MTTQEAVWLIDEFKPYWERGLRGKTMPFWYEAERILRDRTEIEVRSCPCHWRGLAMEVKARYSQREQEILSLYEEATTSTTATPTRTRGRRKKDS